MKKIAILDTSICSTNLGDQIIMSAVESHLNEVFKDDFFIKIPTHDSIGKNSHRELESSNYKIVGGTNLLCSNINSYRQWRLNPYDALVVKNLTLMGVGWWQYQSPPNLYSKLLYKKILSSQLLHSVRDNYAKSQLESIGIRNVINTACPTMWSLTDDHCSNIPIEKSDSVLMTFTNYKKDKSSDAQLLLLLKQNYKQIYFWIQHPKDYEYVKELCEQSLDNAVQVDFIAPSLNALDKALSEDVDYIGTRLHAGVRALQKKKRSLILAVDNRAIEISKDTHLPVIPRNDFSSLKDWIVSNNDLKLNLPWETIEKWKKQFT